MWIQLRFPPENLSIEWIDTQTIKKDFRINPLEYRLMDFNTDDINEIESKVYQNKLNASRRFYPIQQGSNQRSSLYIDIHNEGILEPIQVSISDNMILDGLHRIAVAYDINPALPIPVMFKDYL